LIERSTQKPGLVNILWIRSTGIPPILGNS